MTTTDHPSNTTPVVLVLRRWNDHVPPSGHVLEKRDCPHCDGEGFTECPCCGEMTDLCDECDGSGFIYVDVPLEESGLYVDQERLLEQRFGKYWRQSPVSLHNWWLGED